MFLSGDAVSQRKFHLELPSDCPNQSDSQFCNGDRNRLCHSESKIIATSKCLHSHFGQFLLFAAETAKFAESEQLIKRHDNTGASAMSARAASDI